MEERKEAKDNWRFDDKPKKLVPIGEVKFQDYNGSVDIPGVPSHRYMTCKNHPTALYLSKNPYQRSVHLIEMPVGFPFGEDCPCPLSDLMAIVEE